jgi:predicted aspartyl protease
MRAFGLLGFALTVCFSPMAASADCVASPELASAAASEAARDRSGRVLAPINVNGQGPYRFIVDTGANRSVLSVELAQRLTLTPSGIGDVHTVEGVSSAPLVRGARLSFAGLSLEDGEMPILEGGALARADGLLGVDGLRGRRLLISFEQRCIEIAPSRGARRLRGWLAIPGRLRFGNLVVLQGRVGDARVNLLLDTGSSSSLANDALRAAIDARVRRTEDVQVTTAGSTLSPERLLYIRRLRISGMEVRDVTAFVGGFHVFELWGFADEPTLLIGMDVLSQARGLAIDYERAMVYFQRPR